MPVDQSLGQVTFEKLSRQLAKVAKKPTPKSIHKFRTTGRRVEALLGELVLHPSGNSKKLLKLLAHLRKKAGRVRDLDVQIGLLRGLKLPEAARQKSQLLHTLSEERLQKEKKVGTAFDKATVRELRKRLKRATREIQISEGEPLGQAQRLLAKLARDPGPLTEKLLHQYRIMGKRVRYLAELDGDQSEAARMVEQLKHMQDVIGDWHDWLKLSQRAENLFGAAQGSPLVAALRNVTQAKFRQAADALKETRAESPTKKPPATETAHRTATPQAKGSVTAA